MYSHTITPKHICTLVPVGTSDDMVWWYGKCDICGLIANFKYSETDDLTRIEIEKLLSYKPVHGKRNL